MCKGVDYWYVCIIWMCALDISAKSERFDLKKDAPSTSLDDGAVIESSSHSPAQETRRRLSEDFLQMNTQKQVFLKNEDKEVLNSKDDYEMPYFLSDVATFYLRQEQMRRHDLNKPPNSRYINGGRSYPDYGTQYYSKIDIANLDVMCDPFNVTVGERELLIVSYLSVNDTETLTGNCTFDKISVYDDKMAPISEKRLSESPPAFVISTSGNLTIEPWISNSDQPRFTLYNVSIALIKESTPSILCTSSRDCSQYDEKMVCVNDYCSCRNQTFNLFNQCVQCPSVTQHCFSEGCCSGPQTECFKGRCICSAGYVYYDKECSNIPQDNSYELAAQIALISVLCLALFIVVLVAWKAYTLRRERRLHTSIFMRDRRTASLTSLEREVQLRLENRPPVYSISGDKPPPYEEILTQSQADAETQTVLSSTTEGSNRRNTATTADSSGDNVSTCYDNECFSANDELPVTHQLRQNQTL